VARISALHRATAPRRAGAATSLQHGKLKAALAPPASEPRIIVGAHHRRTTASGGASKYLKRIARRSSPSESQLRYRRIGGVAAMAMKTM